MNRSTVVVVLVAATCSGCSQAQVDPGPTRKQAPDISAGRSHGQPQPAPSRLDAPRVGPGEVTRAVVTGAPGGGSQESTVSAIPVKGRSYLVESACSADDPTTMVSYRLQDSRPDSDGKPAAERLVMAASLACDGVPRVDRAGPLSFPVVAQFDSVPPGVASAYAVVVPE